MEIINNKEMTRIKTGLTNKKKHKKILESNKGFKGSLSKLFKVANQERMKSLSYAYQDRRKKKMVFRKIWIKQIKNQLSCSSKKYNEFIKDLKLDLITLNRKMLSKISIIDSNTFTLLTK